jgi:hypothetical protein
MSFEITVRYTEAILRRAARRFLWRFMGREALLPPAGFLLALLLWFVLDVREWYVVVLGGGCLMLSALVLLAGALSLNRAVKRFRTMKGTAVVWRFDEDGLTSESELGRSEGKWQAASALWRFPEVWLLFFGSASYSTLPADSLAPELRAFLETKVRQAGGKVA